MLICTICKDYGVHKGHKADLATNVVLELKNSMNAQLLQVSSLSKKLEYALVKVSVFSCVRYSRCDVRCRLGPP